MFKVHKLDRGCVHSSMDGATGVTSPDRQSSLALRMQMICAKHNYVGLVSSVFLEVGCALARFPSEGTRLHRGSQISVQSHLCSVDLQYHTLNGKERYNSYIMLKVVHGHWMIFLDLSSTLQQGNKMCYFCGLCDIISTH